MSDPKKLDVTTILKILNAILELKDVVAHEIGKESDAKKRKKYRKAMDKVLVDPNADNIIAFRDQLYRV
ncbi:hypothetical protein KA005_20530 [bacterium]|nr:hypothetical protein [bacterium]